MPNILRRARHYFITSADQRSYYRALRRLFRLNPVLSYLEVHLVDHCNMNCSGCNHFSPLADKSFTNIVQYDRDMKQLSQLMANIKELHLLGGEPLLHPDVNIFFDVTRKRFPKAKIHVITNGILLFSMQEEFWQSCRRNSISVDVTLYPPFHSRESDFVQLGKKEGIALTTVKASTFVVPVNSRGDSEKEKGFKRCRKVVYCPILKDGKIYQCSKPAYGHYFDKAFGTNLPNTGFADLHDPKVNGWRVLSIIEKSPEACRYCTASWEKTPRRAWTKSNCTQKEWDIAS